MPAPSTGQLKQKIISAYGQQLSGDANDFVQMICDKVCDAWQKWQDGITWGTNTITGGGVGAWTGTGTGGVMAGTPFSMSPFSFKNNSPQQIKFTQGLAKTLATKFTAFPSSYKFTLVNYMGTSGATPIAPGPVNAQCVSAPLSGVGSGQNISGLSALWKPELTPPDYDLTNPSAKAGDLVDAVSKAIEQCFQTVWLATTMIQGNIISTAGSPGGVVAGFSSGNDGKLM